MAETTPPATPPKRAEKNRKAREHLEAVAKGMGARQKRPPRHSQQYQLNAPERPTGGLAERPPTDSK